MTTRKPTTLDIADEINEIKRAAWAVQAAIDGVNSETSHPSIQGLAFLIGLHIERIEALEERISGLRAQEPNAA
jgi:hypothetical protein